jgi:hypothetical protein
VFGVGTGIGYEENEMAKPRQFIYRYDGDAKSDEVVPDLEGEIPVPEKNHVMKRKGKKWTVVHVITEQLLTSPPAIPVYRVFLKSQD